MSLNGGIHKVRNGVAYLGKLFYNGTRVISMYCLLLMVPLVVVDVFGRYVLNQPLPKGAADQFASYFQVGLGFLALAYTLKVGGHVSIEIVTSRLSHKARELLGIATYILAIPAWGVFAWKSAVVVLNSVKLHTIAAETLGIIIWPVQVVIPIGMGTLLVVLILEVYKKIKSVRLGEANG